MSEDQTRCEKCDFEWLAEWPCPMCGHDPYLEAYGYDYEATGYVDG